MGVNAPPEIQRLVEKYKLDEKAVTTLTDVILKRPRTAEKDLWEVERRLEGSSNPSAIVMMIIVKLCKGQELPEVRPNNPREREERERRSNERNDRRMSRSRSRS